MELALAAPVLPPSNPPGTLAMVQGAPLNIDPLAPKTLTQAFRRTAEMHPRKGIHIVRHPDQTVFVTYSDLLRRALRVLSGLQHQGLAPGSRVILQLESLEDHFAVFWGCLLGGIVPVTVAIAPTYAERNGVVDKLANTWRLLEEPWIITNARLREAIQSLAPSLGANAPRTLCVEQLLAFPPADTVHEGSPEDVVFMQLSSGSTGVPKCIQQTHQSIIAHIHSSSLFNGNQPENISLNWLPMDHVVPILTFHLKDTYLGCQQIHVATNIILAEPLLWLDLMARHRVTHTWAPNFGFKLVSDRLARVLGRQWDLSSVKFFMNAGEQVTLPVVREFLRALAPFGVKESAMQPAFGMAEVCTCMTYANQFTLKTGARRFAKSSLNRQLMPADGDSGDTAEFVSLGTVSPGVAIRIADAHNDVLPENWIGRLQIRGPVVTPGYFRNDEANREAFVGDGWFNSGDLGFIADGELFLTGREKEMIIIRGAKYYCYEVEDVVNAVPGVEPTFVATCGTGDPVTGTEALAVFFVAAGVTDEVSLVQAIRKRVTARLGIAPGVVVPLPRRLFPKTTSGKIQRTQLRKSLEAGGFNHILTDLERLSVANVAESEPAGVNQEVVRIWEDILGRKNLPVQAHVFELGGDSLKATQIASRLRERWNVDLPPSLLFGIAGTIQGMSDWIAENHAAAGDAPPAIQPVPRTAALPLSYSQQRLWLAEQIDPGTPLYNIGRAFTLKGSLNFAALERAIQAMVGRHEILRTVYTYDSMPAQRILADATVPLPRHDLSHLDSTERSRVVGNLLSAEIVRPFDLATGPLLRAKLIRLGDDENLLMVVCHQIVTDAWSLGLFARELAGWYGAFASDQADPLPPLQVQYADYAAWQRRWLADAALEKQAAFWKQQLADRPAPLRFKSSGDLPDASNASEVMPLILDRALVEKLRAFNSAGNVTAYMTLLTVYALLLSDWAGTSEISVGSPESGRRRFETESLLGCFVNMLALRIRIEDTDTFESLLQRVRQVTIDAYANADVPFEEVQTLVPARPGGRSPLFQVWFGPVDSFQPFSMGNLVVEPRPVFPPAAQFDLSCFLSEQPDTITLFFEFKTGLFTREEMTARLEQFNALLRQLLQDPARPVTEAGSRWNSDQRPAIHPTSAEPAAAT